MPPRKRGSGAFDFGEELRKAASAIKTTEYSSAHSVFAEEPVPLTVFVQDRKFLGNPPLSPIQYDAVRHIERVYYQKTYGMLAEEFETGKREGRLHVASSSAVWREEKYWSQDLRMINFATLQWGKGCKTGSMPIYDAETGKWVPVSEWKGGLVAGADHNGLIRAHAASEAWVSGRGECFRVTTMSGHVDEVYSGHRYLVRGEIDQRLPRNPRRYYSDWRHLRDMKVGDFIAVPSSIPEPTSAKPINPDLVELFGLLTGDGMLPHDAKKRYAVSLTVGTKDTVITKRFTEIVEAFGASIVAEVAPHRINLKAVGTGLRGGNPIINLMREYGLEGHDAFDKRVPDVVFGLPNDQIALFLSRLIDTDGHIYVQKNGSVPEVGYTTASYGLAVDVKRLLLRIGCKAQLQTKRIQYRGETRTYYCVRMRDRSNVLAFCQQITTLSKEPARIAAIAACAEGNGKIHARYGEIAWDKIVSIESIGEHDYWDIEVPGVQNYVSNGTLNHNSGKDHICRVASMRVAYLLLCLNSPQAYYGLPEQDTIHLLNVASSSAQAQQAFFMPIVRAVKKGWFADKCVPKQNVISYDKNIESISGHSDAESQEGLNLLVGIADEIDAFRSKKEMIVRKNASAREPTKSAEGLLNMLRTSASTRFPEVFKIVPISYPRYLGSTIQTLTNRGRADIDERGRDSRHYVSGPMATWEVNPRVKGREAFAEDYREDPIMARAKYECRPALAVNPYFRNVQAVDSAFTLVDREPVLVNYVLEDNPENGRRVWAPRYTFSDDFYPVGGAIYTMHADLAVSGDRAGIAMAHVADYTEYEASTEDEDGAPFVVRETRPIVKVDFAVPFSADTSSDPPREIQIRWARQLCFELVRRGFNIRLLTFDFFQSVDSMQILEARGIEAERLSTNTSEEPWRNLRDLIYEGRITIPRLRVEGLEQKDVPFLLRNELLALSKLPNGKVDHPADGSKDIADAVACAAMTAVKLGGREDGTGERRYFEPNTFTTGSRVELPFGLTGLRSVWTGMDMSMPL